MACFLVSYKPLAIAPVGRHAAVMHGLPLFIDGSCRREPDLESPKPSITALCRAHMFAPRLGIGDEVVYITVKSAFGQQIEPHYRLVAHLRVIHLSDTHDAAALWYRSQGLAIPSNLMVTGNGPRPYEQTNGRNDNGYRNRPEDVKLRKWDGEYRERAKRIGRVVHCEPVYLELHNPPSLFVQDFKNIFCRMPGTQTPPPLSCDLVHELLVLARERNARGVQ